MHPIWNVVSDENGAYILMQFTGLLDKNGKEIWEGDVVTFNDENDTYEVAWSDVYLGWGYRYPHTAEFQGPMGIEDKPTVIGNIYEKSDLMS